MRLFGKKKKGKKRGGIFGSVKKIKFKVPTRKKISFKTLKKVPLRPTLKISLKSGGRPSFSLPKIKTRQVSKVVSAVSKAVRKPSIKTFSNVGRQTANTYFGRLPGKVISTKQTRQLTTKASRFISKPSVGRALKVVNYTKKEASMGLFGKKGPKLFGKKGPKLFKGGFNTKHLEKSLGLRRPLGSVRKAMNVDRAIRGTSRGFSKEMDKVGEIPNKIMKGGGKVLNTAANGIGQATGSGLSSLFKGLGGANTIKLALVAGGGLAVFLALNKKGKGGG